MYRCSVPVFSTSVQQLKVRVYCTGILYRREVQADCSLYRCTGAQLGSTVHCTGEQVYRSTEHGCPLDQGRGRCTQRYAPGSGSARQLELEARTDVDRADVVLSVP